MKSLEWLQRNKEYVSLLSIGRACGFDRNILPNALRSGVLKEEYSLKLDAFMSKMLDLSDSKESAPKNKNTEAKKELQKIISNVGKKPENNVVKIGDNANDAKILDKKNKVYEYMGCKVKTKFDTSRGIFVVSEIV